jgi:hypothetical protein
VRQAGDANQDGQFDQFDLIRVLQADKYLSGEPADWSQGDWNGDGRFDQRDIIAALQTGNYLQGPYASRRFDSRDDSSDLVATDAVFSQFEYPSRGERVSFSANGGR